MHVFDEVKNLDVMRPAALHTPSLISKVRINKTSQRWLIKRDVAVLVAIYGPTVQADQVKEVCIAYPGQSLLVGPFD